MRASRICVLVFAAVPTLAWGADAPRVPAAVPASQPFDIAFGVRLATDYNFRGISQTARGVEPNAYVELQALDNLLYAGVTAYRVVLPNDPAAEIDLTAGVRPKIGPFAFDFGIIYYAYPGGRPFVFPAGTLITPGNTDFTEIAARVTWSWEDRLSIGAGVFHTQNWLASGARATYGNLTGRVVFPQSLVEGTFAASGELGHYWLGTTSAPLGSVNLPDYTYWNLGLSYTRGPVTFDVRYHDTDLSRNQCFALTGDPAGVFSGTGRSRWCDATVIGTISIELTASSLGLFGQR
jgi:uncharacterized protein (TIGR02001 family)